MKLLYPGITSDAPWASHASGVMIYDEDGRDYLDGSSGAMTVNIGHGVPEISEIAGRQTRTIAFAYRSQFRNREAETLAGRLVDRYGRDASVFFMNSGSEANEAAYRIARQYWRRRGRPDKRLVIGRRVSNHGNTVASLSIGHDVRRDDIADIAVNTSELKVAPAYCYRCPFGKTPQSCALDCAEDLERAIGQAGAGRVAAFYLEPVTGALGGALVPDPRYLRRIREICDRHEVLFIADEVVTGMGRLGRWFGLQRWGVEADITMIGKGVTGGYSPLSACLFSRAIVDVIARDGLPIGHTFSGNPLSAAVGNGVLDYLESHEVLEQVDRKGEQLAQGLREIAHRHEVIGDVRGVGLLWALEFVADRETRAPIAPAFGFTRQLVAAARETGLLVYPCRGMNAGGGGDAVLLSPPLVITDAEIALLLRRLDAAVASVAAGWRQHDRRVRT